MRQLNCVRLMLLLLGVLVAALIINPSVATARSRELLVLAPTTGDDDQRGLMNILLTDEAPPAATAAVVKDDDDDAEETARTAWRKRRMTNERVNYRRFGTRWKLAPSSQAQAARFRGHIPFTSDYGRVKRHPPTHN